MTAAATCARDAAGLAWRDIPDAVAAKLRAHLLDTIAVASAGAASKEAGMLRACVSADGDGRCQAIGDAIRLRPADAALVNAFAARRHTFDDTLEAGPIHPGSAVWAAALAAAQAQGAPLSQALLAGLCGYELAVRLADALGPAHYDAGYHGTGTCNAPAAGLAAAVARGLDATGIERAILLAAGAACGTRQYQIDGSICHSALNGARAAATGVQSAGYAAAGLDAPAGQLDGTWGFLAMFGAEGPAAAAFADFGAEWRMLRLSLKPYPTCRFTHGPIELLDLLRHTHALAAESVVGIEMRTFAQSASVSDRPDWVDREEAILSHQFALAATLAGGPPDLAALDRLAADQHVRALAGLVSIRTDPTLEARGADEWPHHLRVRLRGGGELEAMSLAPPGGGPAMRAKAERLIDHHLGPGRCAAIEALLAEPERHAVDALACLFRPEASAHGA